MRLETFACTSSQPDLHEKVEDSKLNLIIQNHEYGVPPSHYDRWPILKDFYNVLTTSKDRNGLEYISTLEAKKYPFTGGLGCPELSQAGQDTSGFSYIRAYCIPCGSCGRTWSLSWGWQ